MLFVKVLRIGHDKYKQVGKKTTRQPNRNQLVVRQINIG